MDWEIERRRFTPEMQREWELRREKKVVRLREEREVKRLERLKQREEAGALSRARRRQEGSGGSASGEEGEEMQAEEPVNKGSATVTRRTSVATTSSASIHTTPSGTTPSRITTPLSHPSSHQNLALAREQFAAGVASAVASSSSGVTGAGGSLFSPGSTTSYMYQSTSGYTSMSSPDSQISTMSSPITAAYSPPPHHTQHHQHHRMSGSISSTTAAAFGGNNSGSNLSVPLASSPAPMSTGSGGTGDRQDYFMNFRTSSTFADGATSTNNATSPPASSTLASSTTNLTLPSATQEDSIGEEEEEEVPEDEVWDSDDEDPEGILGIYELRPSWYPFPECWQGKTLWEEEEVADAGGSPAPGCGGVLGSGAGVNGVS